MSYKVRMGIIGAGETGSTILKDLMKYKFIEIVMVADINENAPGIKIAKGAGIPVTKDFTDIIGLGKNVDVIVDAVGLKEVRIAARYHLKQTRNDHSVIIPEVITLLISALSNNLQEIPKGKHGYQVY